MPWEVPITVGDQTYPVQFNTESEPTQADIDEAVAQILQGSSASPVAEDVEDTGQGRFTSGLSNVGRGALSIIPGAVGGLGYLAEPLIGPGLKKAGAGIEKDIETLLPVNPAYEEEFSQKAAGAIGQAGGMLLTGGVAGALGKGAAAARGLGEAEAAAAGMQLAGRTLLGSGFLSGSREGGQAAERYGMEGVSAYTRALLGGAIEGATEKYLFGLGTELAPVKKFLGDTLEKGVGGIAKMGATEAGEEAAAQAGGNIATKFLAPEGVETPEIGSGVGEAAALGGVAGLALGGVTGLLPSGEKAEPATAAESVTVESGEMPLPAVLKNLDEKVTAAVEANADVLPATAAALKDLESGLTDVGEVEGDVRQGLPIRRGIATPGQEGVADLGALEGDVLSLVPKKSPAAPPAEPTDATEGQPPTPGGVGAPPVVTNEPQTPSPAEQPVSAAQTPVATEPEAPLPETEKVVAPKAEPEQGAGMIATREQSYTTDERENFTKIPRGSRRDRFVISPVTGVVFDRLFSTSVTPPAFSKTEEAVKALNESAYNDNIPVPVALGQREDGAAIFNSAYDGLPTVVLPSSSEKPEAPAAPAPKAEPEQGAGMTPKEWAKTLPDAQEGTGKPNETSSPQTGNFREGQITADQYGDDPYIYRDEWINVADYDPRVSEEFVGLEGVPYEVVARMPTTQQYVEWYRQGFVGPPITIVQNEISGRGKSNNRRRIVAALEAGVSRIPARVEIGRASQVMPVESKTEQKASVKRDTSKPEQMTPKELFEFEKAQAISVAEENLRKAKKGEEAPYAYGFKSKAAFVKAREAELKTAQEYSRPPDIWGVVIEAKNNRVPVAVELVEGLSDDPRDGNGVDSPRKQLIDNLSDNGYVRQGDLYVFAPEAPAAPAPKAEPEQGVGRIQPKIKDRRDSVPVEDRADYDEFMSLMERRGPAQNKVKGFKFTKADEKRFQELGKKLRKYLFETVDPSTDPVIWKDINGQDIHLSAKGTLYTLENGRVRTGPAFESEDFIKGFVPKPVPADFIEKADAADLLPEGYVRQGDLYVFAPEAPPTQTETQPKPEDASKNQVEETGGTPPVESQPPQTRPEGEAQEGASQRGREGEEVRAETAAPGVEPGAAALDAEYVAAVKVGDMAKAQRMVDEAARLNTPITRLTQNKTKTPLGDTFEVQTNGPLYRTVTERDWERIQEQGYIDSDQRGAISLDEGVNLATSIPQSLNYAKKGENVVLLEIKPQGLNLHGYEADQYIRTWDKIPLSNVINSGKFIGGETRPSQLAPVTYDDAGNVIPLSQRFNPETADIRGGGVTKPQTASAAEFGSTNTIFTKEKAEEASKIIKRKLGQTNVPAFDPELFAAATNYAGFLIEGGVRKFGDFSAEMVSRFGESIRPFIKGVYNGVRDIYAMEGMDDAATVSKVLSGETPAPAPAPAPAASEAPLPQTQQTPVARPSGEPFAAPTAESRAAAPGQLATARSAIDEERKRLGRPPVEGPIMEAISDEAIYAQAKAEYDKDPKVGDRLVDSLNARPRAVDSLQQAILGQELVRRRNALDIASDAYIADPKNTQLEDAFNEASAKYEEAKFAAQYGISDVGRTLRLARVLLNLDFSKAGLITRFRQASGGVDPNAEQLKKIDELSKTILESEKKVEELRATKEENARLQELLDNMVQDMKDQAIREFNSVEKARKEAKAAFKAAPNKVSALDTLEEKIRARRAERKKKVMADPFLLNALADAIDDVMLGAIKIAKGVRSVAKWMSEMKAENPDYTDEQLQEIRKASENFYENEIKPELGAEAPAAEVVEEETLEDEEGEDGKVFTSFDDVTGRDIYRMVKDRVQKGMTEIGEVMKSVTEEIQKQLPDVTERQVRDRFSGYGRPLFPSQEASAKKVRELRTLAQYASKIEDAQKKIAPLRSGRQRDDATEAIRQAQKELYRLMKENGLEMPPGPRSLKAPLDVIKRRLKNRRDDLQRQMTAGKRDVVSTKKIERDAEAKALEEEIRALDEALDALDPPLPPSYQDKVKDRMRAVDKEIVELRRKIKERDVSKQKPEPIITEQLQVKLNERDALKQALDDLRIEIEGEPQLTQEEINERAERVLDRNIDALEAEIERLKDPNYFPQEAQKAEATPTIIRLRKQQEILREERKKLSEARFGKKVKSESERVDIAIAALEKSIDNINQKILTGDLSPTARKGTPLENAKIKNLRAERDSLRSVMSLMRKAKADAAKDPVAEQIRRDRKYLQSRIEYYENIQKKMADGTYKPKVKEQRKYDESLGKELQKLEDAKMAVADMLLQERLKNRSTLRKAFDFIGDLFGIQRVLTATADISAIGNQGNFILFSNPKIAFKAIPDMLRAMKTPEGEKAVQERIRNMPEYKDGELSRVGLYLAMDAGPNSPLSKMEEQYATRLVNKWPKAFGGGIVRGSERAYKTFLDVIRVAAYKSMKETLVKGGWFTPPQEATQERLEALSNLVNNATGRGAFKMKKADQLLSQAAPFLNTFIFAPRFGLSRFAMALGLPLWRAAPGTRALIAQEYAKYAIGVTVASLLLSLAQDDEDEPIVPDPRSTDFLKTRFGDYRVDLLGGFQQPFVFLTRMLTGETVTRKGNVRALREGDRPLDLLRERPLKLKPNYGSADASSVLGDFLRFKLAPTSASILNALNSKDPVGNRTDVKSEILKAPVPLVVGQLVESLSAEDPADAALLSILGLTGIRTSYQGKDADKNKTEWEKMVKKVEELTGIK